MKFVKTIRKVLDHDADGVSVRGEINAVVAANVKERKVVTGAGSASESRHRPSPQTKPTKRRGNV